MPINDHLRLFDMVKVDTATIQKRQDIFQKVLKGFALVSVDDNSIITREQAAKCLTLIQSLRKDIINTYPAAHSIRCKLGVRKSTDCITVLRQLLRYYNRRLISKRKKVPKTRGNKMYYMYKIAT